MERRLRACRKGERNDADKEGGRAREGARGQASRQNSILPKPKLKVPQGPCAGRGNREPPGSTDRKSSGCPKGQAVNILSALANPRGGEAAPGTHDAHQQRDPPPSLPGQPPGKLQLDGKTHAQHTCSSIRPIGPQGQGHSPASVLPNSQASQCPGQSSSRHHPWTQGLPGQGSPHCPLFSRGPPAAAVQLCFCQAIWGAVPCAASDQRNMLPARLHAHRPPLKGCFVFLACKGRELFLQLSNTVWGLQWSNGSQKPPAHECHTPIPRMPACRGWTIDLRLNKAQRDVGPLLATLHRHRLLWKLLVPHRLWKWTYCFLQSTSHAHTCQELLKV